MAKVRTPSFIVEVPLCTGPHELRTVDVRLAVGCYVYNACLREASRRLRRLRGDPRWAAAACAVHLREASGFLESERVARSRGDSQDRGPWWHHRGRGGGGFPQNPSALAVGRVSFGKYRSDWRIRESWVRSSDRHE